MNTPPEQKTVPISRKRENIQLRPHVVVSGYYGFDNLGDELILRVLIDALKARNVDITVLSANPAKTRQMYDVAAISRTSIPDIVNVFSKAQLFISGGGGLFQDATGPMSAIYYGGLIHLASLFKIPVCFWAQGVGPLNGKMARWFTGTALRQCDAIIVRDDNSAALVSSLAGFRPAVSADPVWLLSSTGSTASENPHTQRKYVGPSGRLWCVGISLRTWPALTEARLKNLAAALLGYAVAQSRPVAFHLLPFQGSEDIELLEAFATHLRQLSASDPAFKHGEFEILLHTPEQAMGEVAHCDVLLGMRFHSLILALLYGVAVYGLPYDPKVATLLSTFNLQGCPVTQLESLTSKALKDSFAHYPSVNLKPLQKQSQRNLLVLDDLLSLARQELVF